MKRLCRLAAVVLCSLASAAAQSGGYYVIDTIAGPGTVGDGGAATEAWFHNPFDAALDADGNLYIVDKGNHRIRRVDAAGDIATFAGSGLQGFSGDGGPAGAARLSSPGSVVLDAAGNLYIADTGNQRVRKVHAATGNISTIAGTGLRGSSGDGGPASAARLFNPAGMALDSSENLYIANRDRVRRIDAATGVISTFAGNGSYGFSGDGGPASAASLRSPVDVALDAADNLYIADRSNHRIRKVDAVTGIISTIAGTGAPGFGGDGGPASAARFSLPRGLAADADDNLYIAANNRVRRIDAATGIIATIAGAGTAGFSGDGGPATSAQLNSPYGLTPDADGNLYIADRNNHLVRRIDAATGVISTFASANAAIGDGGPASAARLRSPVDVARDAAGNLYIAEIYEHRVRKVDAVTSAVSTIAGTGTEGYSGDGGPATAAQLRNPRAVAPDAAGNLYIADQGNHRIRKVDTAGNISTFAGTGTPGHTGEGGAATAARIFAPRDAAADASGNLYIAYSNVVRKVDTMGNISTFAGTGSAGFSGDGGPATAAQLRISAGVAADASGNLYIVDQGNRRIRRVDADGNISTIAGDGTAGFSGDGGAATAARLRTPAGVAADAAGNIYIADQGNGRIRKVDAATGAISTIAGTGRFGSSGDGGPATAASMDYPYGLIADGDGIVYFADQGARRIRRLIPASALPSLPPPRITLQAQPSRVAPGGEAALIWTASGAATLTMDQDMGEMTPPATGRVIVRPRRTTTYTAVARSAAGREAAAAVTVAVIAPMETGPQVHARPLTLRFTLPQDALPEAQAAALYVVDGDSDSPLEPALDWSVQSSARWLTAAPRQGSLPPGREQTLTVSADPAGMRAGSHRARLFVRTQERITARIRVSLDVLPPLGPAVSEHGVINAAARSAFGRPGLFGPQLLPLAPGSLVAVEGLNFLPAGAAPRQAEDLPLPTALGGVRVLFDGIAAPLFRVETESIAAQLPAALGAAALEAGRIPLIETVVEAGGRRSWPRRFPLAPQAPGVFTASGQGRGQALALLLDGGGLAAPRGYAVGSRPARAGDLVEICATGLGAVEPPLADGMNSCPPDGRCPTDGSTIAIRHTRVRPQVWIGGYRLGGQDVLFSFLEPNFVGVNSVIVRIPRNIPANAAAEVVIAAGGRRSQPGVTVAVE